LGNRRARPDSEGGAYKEKEEEEEEEEEEEDRQECLSYWAR